MRKRGVSSLLSASCLLVSVLSLTKAGTIDHTKRYQAPQGFHWYQVTPLSPPTETTRPPETSNPVKQMAALRAMVNEALDRAILYPSVENATRYLALNNLLMQHANQFSVSVKQALLAHPEMSYAITHPTQNAARKLVLKEKEARAMQAVNQLSHHNGLVFFYRGKQPLDQLMAKTLANFSQRYKTMQIVGISIDHTVIPLFATNKIDTGQAHTLHVSVYPALLLVNPDTHHVQPVAYGVLSESELLDRFLSIATVQQQDATYRQH